MPTSNHTNDIKVTKIIDKIMKLLNKAKLNVPELLVLYGNLGYHIGASMAGYEGEGPSVDELKQAYHQNPTVDVALMSQGLMITDWEKDFLKSPQLSKNKYMKGEL